MTLLNSLLPSFNRQVSQRENSATPTLRPFYQIEENDDNFVVTVQLPGVLKSDLSVTDEDGTLTIRGDRNWKQPSEWTSLYRESRDLSFSLELEHDNHFDAERANAELKDGVLRLTLPKSEARKPRKISVA